MSNVLINPAAAGSGLVPTPIIALVAGGAIGSIALSAVASAAATYLTDAATSSGLSGSMSELRMKTNMANAFMLAGVRFTQGGKQYITKADGTVQTDLSPVTGIGTAVGTLTPAQGELKLTSWGAGSSPVVTGWRAIASAPVNGTDTPYNTYGVTFRIATAPIKPSSFSLLGTMVDGTTFNVQADSGGFINATRVKGRINYATGVVRLVFVTPSAPAGQTTVDLSYLGIPGVSTAYIDMVRQETLRYNAVAYTYLPLDADRLGIDPVRLPSDGRVPIFRPGGIVVVGHTATTTPATAANGGTVNTGRTRLSRVRVIGANGQTIQAGYTVDLETGIVTWTNVTGYSQPVRVEHRIEDMAQIRDVQIDGTLTLMRPLTHVFPSGSYVSSALIAGDLRARVSLLFDQGSFDGTTWSDVATGSAATATYNDTDHPIAVTNSGAVTERWALRFTSTTQGQIIGEHLGVVGTFSINTPTAPINSVTGEPYFVLSELGWGTGWSIGNVVRFNTVGAMAPIWVARTIQQGPESGSDYTFTLLVRGDIDNPN
jgi:hypothetical protein